MPSSEEIHEAAAEVRKWYYEKVIVPRRGDNDAAREISKLTSYVIQLEEVKRQHPNMHFGAYSPY